MPEISEAAVEAATKVLVNRVGWTQSWPSEHTKSVITEMLIAAAPELIPSLTSRLSAVERERDELRTLLAATMKGRIIRGEFTVSNAVWRVLDDASVPGALDTTVALIDQVAAALTPPTDRGGAT